MTKWFYFEPRDKDYSNPIFVEIDTKANAEKFLTQYRKFDLYDYSQPVAYNTFDYATHFQRGCAFNYPEGVLKIYEKQRVGSFYKYQTIEQFKKSKNVNIFYRDETEKFLKKLEAQVTKAEFDGCNCRECGKSVLMAAPDDLDGKFTCYLCKERLKCYGGINVCKKQKV